MLPLFILISQNRFDLKLNKLLNSGLRFIYSLKHYQQITPFRRRANQTSLFHPYLHLYPHHYKTPIPLASFLPPLPNNEQYINRHTSALFTRLPKPSIDTFRGSFICYGLQEFEKLSYRIKISIYKHLFHNDQS